MKKPVIIIFFILVISTFEREKLIFPLIDTALTEPSTSILKTAYRKIGYDIEFVLLPAKRALIEANSGRIDGETGRIKNIENSYPNLIRIDVPIIWFELRLFSAKHDLYIDDLNKLKKYKFGIKRGIVLYEEFLKDFSVFIVNDESLIYKNLESGRFDFILTTNFDGLKVIASKKYKGIRMLDPPLKTIYLYHYLHKKHKDIVPKLTKVLKEMEENGEIQDNLDSYFKNKF